MTSKDLLSEIQTVYKNKPNRLKHVLGVRDTAVKLGEIHHLDLEKLETAALLHDITKYYPKEKNIELIHEHFDNADEIVKEFNEHILHAFSAYVVAKEVYNIKDTDVLDAIKYHTIGRKDMTMYEKIIFISDYIEPNRTYDSCVKVREIAFENIDLAVYTAIDDSIIFYENTGGQVPKSAYLARDFYYNILGGKV
ncbi:putative nicotinate-nucleotide adenylyltransferase [Candidatus Izimaplasma bacterium HR1]|jgi:predicted HD superfamily hydrolase involved in NAD metabolism|uniref:bis(5'-nucleosyl)-tetraphosphatase (symmetrical) YqeK n=1 Tax=Candidatus Izimoplasma sp. HR1 TaxID=1541959 RepID=UPI0004F8475F|nr:putative nicotinate-nucleotide adenylyltransferase [Candidatus Izimaplasma bacterium HR1]